MTDDITRGLALLADEAEPATVNADEVITRARARTRNRRATAATAIATVLVLGVLVATLSPSSDPTPVTTPPESLVNRLNSQLTEALPDVLPSIWSLPKNEPPLTFQCNVARVVDSNDEWAPFCDAQADYNDGRGGLDVRISVNRLTRDSDVSCAEPECVQLAPPVRQELPDGTSAQVVNYTEKPTSRDIQELRATRPDGTQVSVVVLWPEGLRSKTPLTTHEILKFATVFDFGDAVVPAAPTSQVPRTDPKKAGRLTTELNDVLEAVIPAGWSRAPDEEQSDEGAFAFDCSEGTSGPGTGDGTPEDDPKTMMSCWTAGYYRDATGLIGIKFSVSPDQIFGGTCDAANCVEKYLSDHTRTQMKKELHDPIATYTHSVSAFRPDGTVIWVEVFWTDQRAQTPLTDDQLLKFATAFTY